MDTRERSIRQRLRADFPHYARTCLRIRSKGGEILPLHLNAAQQYLHQQIERQRAETGRVRALILKGRQQGCSTYTEGRFYWRVSHRRGVRAFILTHHSDATNNLFGMAKRYHEHCPELVRPSTAASNARELVFDRLDSGYKVGTAGTEGVGRSDTIQYLHGSEVAYWPNADGHMAGALQAVPDEPETEIILESTSAGPQGRFFDMCQQAAAGQGEYRLIFIPWYWQAEYRREAGPDFQMTADEEGYAAAYGLDAQQIAWRRAKIAELGGVSDFRREYPATAEEAFRADAQGALWQRASMIDTHRVVRVPELVRLVVAIDPAASSGPKSDDTGIVAAGLGTDGHGYVLEDLSCHKSPDGWARVAVSAYDRLRADVIIAEANNGGEMVASTIQTFARGRARHEAPVKEVPVRLIHASRGKQTRAEPVAALYEQGKVHHVGLLGALEDQLCTWVPGKSDWSPDRLDAMVWAVTDLLLGPGEIERLDGGLLAALKDYRGV